MSEQVLFVGGPLTGQRSQADEETYFDWFQTETPVRNIHLDPWKYDHIKRKWVCRYTRRRQMAPTDPVIYAPQDWSNAAVLSELIRGYK